MSLFLKTKIDRERSNVAKSTFSSFLFSPLKEVISLAKEEKTESLEWQSRVRTLSFPFRGHRFDLWSGTKNPHDQKTREAHAPAPPKIKK